ncbi:MFP1 protein [Colletotrichum costaricense]|uniref:MFP1 protein n=1 Tax=Colletotrichum costaricense TaxID=1209916 RepID=A0AAJ0DZ03_9PEZI|nr:MFP1 protein [Colletotrichum costaricense]KAK1522190.1 MFP1 protein [Colletotrichum costaricense]
MKQVGAGEMRLSLIALAAVLLGSASAKSLSQALISHGSLSMLHDLLKDLDLLERFQTAERSTFLAMTDDALVGLANWGLNMSTIDPALASAILEYHFLEGVFTSSDPSLKTDAQLAHSVLRPPILTNVTDGPAVKLSIIDGSLSAESGIQKVMPINESDITYDNGVLHTIDSNLVLPHNLSETTNLGNLHKFWDLVERSKTREILEAMKDVTVFLPDDKAVRQWSSALGSLTPEQLATIVANHAIPNRVLYHSAFSAEGNEYKTLSGMKVTVSRDSRGNIFVNEAKILKEDVLIFGGVAHILDGVLVPSGHRACQSLLNELRAYTALYPSSWKVMGKTFVVATGAFSLTVLAFLTVRNRRSKRRLVSSAWTTASWEAHLRSITSEKYQDVYA